MAYPRKRACSVRAWVMRVLVALISRCSFSFKNVPMAALISSASDFGPDETQDEIVRIANVLQSPEVGVIHILRGSLSPLPFEFFNSSPHRRVSVRLDVVYPTGCIPGFRLVFFPRVYCGISTSSM